MQLVFLFVRHFVNDPLIDVQPVFKVFIIILYHISREAESENGSLVVQGM